MLEAEIVAYVSDGNEYSAEAISSAMGVPSFLLQTSIDGLVPHKLSCRAGSPRLYSSRTVKSKMPDLDEKIDSMKDRREPGFRPTDPTAIIAPRGTPAESFSVDVTIGESKWGIVIPDGISDLPHWTLAGLGWEVLPQEKDPEPPCASPIRWMGGKSKMLEWLLARFPEHHTYVEVFGGSMKPLFGKKPSKVEVVNDKYEALINFWRVCSQWPNELADAINALPSSRIYQRWFQREYAHRNEFEWAVMFGYLSLNSYNGLVWKPYAGSAHSSPGKASPETFKRAARRLRGVWIECADFRDIITRYSLKRVAAGDVFTYLDPPYLETEGYALKFPDEWHMELAEAMVKINEAGNKVLMTNSNKAGDKYMKWFGPAKGDFQVNYVDVDYTLGHAESRGARQESVISNFPLVTPKQKGLFS